MWGNSVVHQLITNVLPHILHDGSSVVSVMPISGGDINQAWKITTHHRSYFLKYNQNSALPRFFACEAEGLSLLDRAGKLNVPEVLHHNDSGEIKYIILNYIEPGVASKSTFEQAGRQLAHLHRCTAPQFGFSSENYIGTLNQPNDQNDSFVSFFYNQRLEPLARMAVKKGFAPVVLEHKLEQLSLKLHHIIPEESPALLHGDLWCGNMMTRHDGQPVFVDPSVYYGHREADLAMSHLFGGFMPCFYDAYNESFPLQNGASERVDLFNLYPLLVHLNLFGVGYLKQIEQILSRL